MYLWFTLRVINIQTGTISHLTPLDRLLNADEIEWVPSPKSNWHSPLGSHKSGPIKRSFVRPWTGNYTQCIWKTTNDDNCLSLLPLRSNQVKEDRSDQRHLWWMFVPTHMDQLQEQHRIWGLSCEIAYTSLNVPLTLCFKAAVQPLTQFMYAQVFNCLPSITVTMRVPSHIFLFHEVKTL